MAAWLFCFEQSVSGFANRIVTMGARPKGMTVGILQICQL
jgi:hypothetical protein